MVISGVIAACNNGGNVEINGHRRWLNGRMAALANSRFSKIH